jgi:hypothetical protein
MPAILRARRCAVLVSLLLSGVATLAGARPEAGTPIFTDDFESGLSRWVPGGTGADGSIDVHDAGDAHGQVLRLRSNGDVHALIRGSDRWGGVALEGDVLFPAPGDSYLGVMYHVREARGRMDFGLVYLKYGRRVYLQANPHRDYNVTRTFYPEYEAPLVEGVTVEAGEWSRFRVEIVRGVAHFYVGDLATPAMTFAIAEPGAGMLGLQPRSVGEEVWIDNVVVTPLEAHSYRGPPRPAIATNAGQWDRLAWEVLGPLPRTDDRVARDDGSSDARWSPFELDPRGAIETARVVDYHGLRTVAYFRARWRSDRAGEAVLRVSSVDDVAVWVNGAFAGFYAREAAAWFDAGTNPEHPGTQIAIPVAAGINTLVLRVRGGAYAAGGLFARIEQDGVVQSSPDPGAR